ncbi:putative 5-hydroxytryptamine receptor 3A-like [Scophthalmus maximus]|uniref:Putative 5-hydroxytryptamine receptor 3A-like n=1 Tax=Scophthalmus maximus TaxID=52904 RepID=A0A2U9CY42_SCOMX|nr:putative 5-hydroxytryptamine receptor 3A-like [Scophthalmus maximus]
MVFASKRQRLTSTCQLDLYLFPFDVQRCNITFASMNYFAESLELGTTNSDETLTLVSERLMVTQGEWQLTNIAINNYTLTKSVFSESRLIYTVTITRKPMLYVVNFILPLFYFLLLDLASFFIRGEKLSFKVTVLLSISVLLLILKDMLPSTEENLPFMASYCVAVFTLVGLSVLEVMLVNFLMELDGYCGEQAQRSVNTREVEIQLEADSQKQPAGAEERGRVTLAKTPGDHRDLLKLILEEVRAARQETGRPEDGRKPGCYTRLAEIIDTVYFVLYFLTVVKTSVVNHGRWNHRVRGTLLRIRESECWSLFSPQEEKLFPPPVVRTPKRPMLARRRRGSACLQESIPG